MISLKNMKKDNEIGGVEALKREALKRGSPGHIVPKTRTNL